MKLFNKKRFQLFKGTRVQKYLTYAIGEILLVVIGILIALAINNWSKSKADESELERIISLVKIDLNSDLKEAQIIINSSKDNIKLTQKIFYDDSFKDSLRACEECKDLMNIVIPFNQNRKGVELLKSYNKEIRTQSTEVDSILSFYNDYKAEDFKIVNEFVLNVTSENFKYMRDNYDWFSDYLLKGICEDECLDYFSSQTYLNRLAFFDLMANDNYFYSILSYRNELRKILSYLDTYETIQ